MTVEFTIQNAQFLAYPDKDNKVVIKRVGGKYFKVKDFSWQSFDDFVNIVKQVINAIASYDLALLLHPNDARGMNKHLLQHFGSKDKDSMYWWYKFCIDNNVITKKELAKWRTDYKLQIGSSVPMTYRISLQ